jgi:predicted GNAT family N-acyltransferase
MASEQAELRWVSVPAELEGALEVRRQVFCLEQGVPLEEELDGRDGEAEHLVAIDWSEEAVSPLGGRVVGTLRLLYSGLTAKVGRVAVLGEWRRRGIAAAMLELALQRARERGCSDARLCSQVAVVELYERAGFKVCSDEFEEAGIAHVWMERTL